MGRLSQEVESQVDVESISSRANIPASLFWLWSQVDVESISSRAP